MDNQPENPFIPIQYPQEQNTFPIEYSMNTFFSQITRLLKYFLFGDISGIGVFVVVDNGMIVIYRGFPSLFYGHF